MRENPYSCASSSVTRRCRRLHSGTRVSLPCSFTLTGIPFNSDLLMSSTLQSGSIDPDHLLCVCVYRDVEHVKDGEILFDRFRRTNAL